MDDIVKRRTELISSEVTRWRNKRGRDYFYKTKERRLRRYKKSGDVIVGELKSTLSSYLKLVKERDALTHSDLKAFISEDRLKDKHIVYERES